MKSFRKRTITIILICFVCFQPGLIYQAHSQVNTPTDSLFKSKKTVEAKRITAPPRIDGRLDEPFWKSLPVAGQFVQYSPVNGGVPSYPTEIRFAFDDVALYIGAILFDPHPDSICKELGRRDQVEQLNSDMISFDILPYDDDLNMYEFKLTPSNVQNDCKYSAIGQDITWDAVWESATSINSEGWIAEVRIPFSALRFSAVEKQVWGFNSWRNIQRKGEWATWTFVDIKDQSIFRYYGDLTGINNITPPFRLSLTPYLTGYLEKKPDSKTWDYFARGGIDLRYGISESYTIDMMLIPDFGQIQSDDQVLNLTPFETMYDEKRQFFTEGTELFDKCDIFYSRRVGSTPKNYLLPYYSLKDNEIVSNNPDETRIINATKVSGRNRNGLGIGVFNGMTTNTRAELEDTLTGARRKIMTQPFTNYNVLVFDQNLKNNSYITLINTNYYTPDDRYVSDVTGVEARLGNKKNTFAFFGRGIVSQQYREGAEPVFGHRYTLKLSKPSGKFQYTLSRDEIGDTYDPNDMGFLLYNNEATNQAELNYIITDPFWKIRNTQTSFITTYATLVKPSSYTSLQFAAYNQTVFKNFWTVYLLASIRPIGSDDYYEPRVTGWYFHQPLNYTAEMEIGSDQRKSFRMATSGGITNTPENKNFSWWVCVTPRIRFSDRFTTSLTVQYNMDANDRGWVNTMYDEALNPVIWFGRRDVSTFNNILNAKYIFNTKTSLSLRFRHYWSSAVYFDYYTLGHDGELTPGAYSGDENISFNAFTADLQFVWYFAPGSELSIVWKNDITQSDKVTGISYWNDLDNTLGSPQTNSFSIKVLYYLDYQYLKKWLGKKKNYNG